MRKVNCNKQVLTLEQEQFVRDNLQQFTNKQLADRFGMKLTTLRYRLSELGLKRIELEYWTEEQVKFLVGNYREYGDVELAEIFEVKWHKNKGWTKQHIIKKRLQLGLDRDDDSFREIIDRNAKAGRYSTGKKNWEGRVCPVGECRVWKRNVGEVVVIRLKAGFAHYAHWLWGQVFGAIPDGHVVTFIDGNPLNVTIANLKLLSRGELAVQNSRYAQLPEDLKDTIELLNNLNKKIYEKQDFGFKKPHVRST